MVLMSSALPAPSERLLLRLSRLAWFTLTLISLALFMAGVPGRFFQLQSSADPRVLSLLGMSQGIYAFYLVALNVVLVAVNDIVAAVLFFRRRYDWMALGVAVALVANGVIFPLSLMYPPDSTPVLTRIMVEIIIFTGLISGVCLLFIFPDGKFIPRWTVWLVVLWALINIPSILFPDSLMSLRNWPIPIQLLILTGLSATGIIAQIYRFINVSNLAQRQQAKWAIFGLAAAVLGPFAYFLPFVILPNVTGSDVPNLLFNRIGSSFYAFSFIFRLVATTFFSLLSLLFPISFAVAIFRYKLWEIDILINRALVYGALSSLLAIIYLVSVILFQQLIQLATGFRQSEIATAASTLLIAAMFVPLQRRVQAAIDRRFYRNRYNAARTLEAFTQSLRDEVELEPLVKRLMEVVEDTIQPQSLSLWLNKLPEMETVQPASFSSEERGSHEMD